METEDPRIEGKDPWKDYIYHQANGFGSTYNRSLPEHERARAILRPSNHPEHLNKYLKHSNFSSNGMISIVWMGKCSH